MMTRYEFYQLYTEIILFADLLTRLNYGDLEDRKHIAILRAYSDKNPMANTLVSREIRRLESKYITDNQN